GAGARTPRGGSPRRDQSARGAGRPRRRTAPPAGEVPGAAAAVLPRRPDARRGGGAAGRGGRDPEEPPGGGPQPPTPPPRPPRPPKADRLDGPLPAGALMRLGTVRHQVERSPRLLPDGKTVVTLRGDRLCWMDVDAGTDRRTWPLPPEHRLVGLSADCSRAV